MQIPWIWTWATASNANGNNHDDIVCWRQKLAFMPSYLDILIRLLVLWRLLRIAPFCWAQLCVPETKVPGF